MSLFGLRGFGAFTRKELLETRRTWRLWVLPGVLVFLGLTTPVLTAATPALIRMTTQGQSGVVVSFPAPVALDAYAEFLGNLAQLALLVVIVTSAAAVAGERRGGTGVLVLTKPLARTAFVWAKALAGLLVLAAATALGTGLCVLVTVALFDASHVAAFLSSVALWLLLAAMFVCLTVWLSAALGRQAAAAGAGIAAWVAVFVLSGFPVVRDHSPAGLLAAGEALLAGRDAALAGPVLVTVTLSVAFLVAAAWSFRGKEL